MKTAWLALLILPTMCYASIPRNCRSPQLIAQAKASIPRILKLGKNGQKIVSIEINYDSRRLKNPKHGYWIACSMNVKWSRPLIGHTLWVGWDFIEWYNSKGTLMTGFAPAGIPLKPWSDSWMFQKHPAVIP